MLAKKFRLKKSDQIESLVRPGTPLKNDLLVLKYRKNELEFPRVTVVVTLKIAPKATVRNRLRRQIYAALHSFFKSIDFRFPYDLAILTRSKINHASYAQIKTALENLISKIKTS